MAAHDKELKMTRAPDTANTVFCGLCGTPTSTNARYCARCGSQLSTPIDIDSTVKQTAVAVAKHGAIGWLGLVLGRFVYRAVMALLCLIAIVVLYGFLYLISDNQSREQLAITPSKPEP
jgi:uncharacterized membrane protein YvbJ